MPGGKLRGADPVGQLHHRVDSQVAVTDDAGIWGLPRPVAVHEGSHHLTAKRPFEIESEVRDAHANG